MSEVLHKFGSLVATQHPRVQESLLPLLSNSKAAVRKRTSVAIGRIKIVLGRSRVWEH